MDEHPEGVTVLSRARGGSAAGTAVTFPFPSAPAAGARSAGAGPASFAEGAAAAGFGAVAGSEDLS